ncbi:MAG: sensor histidine kinase [Actinomycetota bacterium]
MTEETKAPRMMSFLQPNRASVFGLLVVIPTLGALAFLFTQGTRPIPLKVLPWAILITLVELLPVTTWGGVTVSVGYPLIMAVAFTFSPEVAAFVALISASDPREFRREVTILRALFNRCQIALAVLAASSVFHAVSSVNAALFKMLAATLLAIVVDYVITLGLVTVGVCLVYSFRPLRVIKELLGQGQEFVVSYLGLGALGASLARLNSVPRFGFFSVLTVLAPLLFARQMFLRSQALEEAHQELKVREQVLRSLSNAMAEERADERQKIAAYLHDDLAQVLFRLSIQVDVARKLLEKGDLTETGNQLEKIRESKQDTSDRIRALIRDLHRSPLGAKGLAEALESFTDEVGRDSGVHFHLDVHDVAMPAPIALLIYHIAREGLMNALKHAQAADFWITVRGDDEFLELQLRDNGVGFDTALPGPEGHFGMAMMRERAQVGGGSSEVLSVPGQGTTVTVKFPTSLLQQEATTEPVGTEPAADTPEAHASPDTSGAGEPAGDGSRGTVHV